MPRKVALGSLSASPGPHSLGGPSGYFSGISGHPTSCAPPGCSLRCEPTQSPPTAPPSGPRKLTCLSSGGTAWGSRDQLGGAWSAPDEIQPVLLGQTGRNCRRTTPRACRVQGAWSLGAGEASPFRPLTASAWSPPWAWPPAGWGHPTPGQLLPICPVINNAAGVERHRCSHTVRPPVARRLFNLPCRAAICLGGSVWGCLCG